MNGIFALYFVQFSGIEVAVNILVGGIYDMIVEAHVVHAADYLSLLGEIIVGD